MKKFKLFFILTIICCLLVSMVGCSKVKTKQNDNEIITETIDTTAIISGMDYTIGSNLFKINWRIFNNHDYHAFEHLYDPYEGSQEGDPISSYNKKDINPITCTSYVPIKQYEKCKKIFNNKEEVKVTLVINYTYAKDGYYTEVSRKVIPNFK